MSFFARKYMVMWQAAFLLLGTTWLLAPYLNPLLSSRTSLISQYETSTQPYSWLFRLGDLLAGVLLLAMATKIIKTPHRKTGWLLLAISLGLITDPLLPTTCHTIGKNCQEYFSFDFLLHAIESTFTATVFFAIALYDGWKRRKAVSIIFAGLQILYGLLFVTQLANKDFFNTTSQYIYQAGLIAWTAWLCRDLMAEQSFSVSIREKKLVKNAVAIWAFVNGVLAIIISLAHLSLLGRIKGLYFSGDTAWLAQHGVVVGVVMLYLSRHLARGESRARQIFLLLSGIEAIKYATISPDIRLTIFYLLTFTALFVLRDDFDRGNVAMTWRLKLRDLYFLLTGLVLSGFISLVLLDRDGRVSSITTHALDHFADYVVGDRPVHHSHLESALLAHTISTFVVASLAAVFWVLFRPYKTTESYGDASLVERLLDQRSNSSEDYFKLWPKDKTYYWDKNNQGFIAYKRAGSTAFALADPIAPNPSRLLNEFNSWCRQHRLRVCYLPVSKTSLPLYQQAGLDYLKIGSSALINIVEFLDSTSKEKWWRWRLNKSQKAGYIYAQASPPHSPEFIDQLKIVSDAWLAHGGHRERGFALGYFDPNYLGQCTIHYLHDGQRIIAFTNQLPSFNNQPVMTVDLLRYLPQSDSMAFLLYKTIESGRNTYKKFDLGFVPFAKAEGPLLTVARTISSERFSAKGLEQFKNKFEPAWEPNYLVYDGDIADLASIAISLEKVMLPSPVELRRQPRSARQSYS